MQDDSSALIVDFRSDTVLTVRNCLFENNLAASVVRSSFGHLFVDNIEVRRTGEYNKVLLYADEDIHASNVILAPAALSSEAVIEGVDVFLDNVALDTRGAFIHPRDELTVEGLTRFDGGCGNVFDSNSIFGPVDVLDSHGATTDFCGTCGGPVSVFTSPPRMWEGSYTFDGTLVDDLPNLTYTSADCPSLVFCGASPLFTATAGGCRNPTLEASLTDCAGTLGGTAFVDVCGRVCGGMSSLPRVVWRVRVSHVWK